MTTKIAIAVTILLAIAFIAVVVWRAVAAIRSRLKKDDEVDEKEKKEKKDVKDMWFWERPLGLAYVLLSTALIVLAFVFVDGLAEITGWGVMWAWEHKGVTFCLLSLWMATAWATYHNSVTPLYKWMTWIMTAFSVLVLGAYLYWSYHHQPTPTSPVWKGLHHVSTLVASIPSDILTSGSPGGTSSPGGQSVAMPRFNWGWLQGVHGWFAPDNGLFLVPVCLIGGAVILWLIVRMLKTAKSDGPGLVLLAAALIVVLMIFWIGANRANAEPNRKSAPTAPTLEIREYPVDVTVTSDNPVAICVGDEKFEKKLKYLRGITKPRGHTILVYVSENEPTPDQEPDFEFGPEREGNLRFMDQEVKGGGYLQESPKKVWLILQDKPGKKVGIKAIYSPDKP